MAVAVFFYDSLPVHTRQWLFVIDLHKRGFFAVKNEYDYIYLQRTSHGSVGKAAEKKYKEVFTGNGFTATLTTHLINPTDRSLRQGTLVIQHKNQTTTITVKGQVDY